MTKEEVQGILGQVARSWEGQKEISGNQGFVDADFEEKMEDVGWRTGQAWCAYFAELVWKQGYRGIATALSDEGSAEALAIINQLSKLFSGSAVATLRNFTKSGDFEVSEKPVEGAIAIWQSHRNGKASWTGHAGVVIGAHEHYFVTIEGNTNSQGGREGVEVARKVRKFRWTTQNGLRLKGFIHPKAV